MQCNAINILVAQEVENCQRRNRHLDFRDVCNVVAAIFGIRSGSEVEMICTNALLKKAITR